MTECHQTLGAGRHSRAGVARLAAVLALGSALSWAQQAGPMPAQRGVGAMGGAASGAPAVRPSKTPRQMAEQLVGVLAKQKTPPQIYANYAQIFLDFALREANTSGGSQAVTLARRRLAEHLNGMAMLLSAMGEQARVRDAIRRGASQLPLEQRQPVFAQAGIEHQRLLAEFARMGAALPQRRAPTAVARR